MPNEALSRRVTWLAHAATLPLLVFGAAMALRLIDLGRRPFWLDEVFTMQRVSLSPAALVHDSFLNHHMPSFFLLLSALVPLGEPQFWLRLPPAVFGALSVMLVYMIGKQINGRNAGLAAALVLGLSPAALAFSQEARSYTMEMCMILVALFGMSKLAMDVPAASVSLRNRGSMRAAWAIFTIGSAAALDVLGDGLPWVATANLIFAVLVWQSTQRRALLWNIVAADVVITGLSAPFYIIMALTVQNGFVHSFDWIPPLNAPRIWYNIGSVYLMRVADSVTFNLWDVPTPSFVIWLIDAALLAAVAFGSWRLRTRPAALAAIGLSFIVLPVAVIFISVWKPMLLPRYILWSQAPFAVLAGVGASLFINTWSRPARRCAFAAAAIALTVNLFPYYGAETKPRWDIAAKLLASEVAPGDVIYMNDKGALPVLRMYLPPGTEAVVLNDADGSLKHAEQAQLQGKRVWAVFGHAGQSASHHEWPQFYKKIAPLGTPSQIQMAGGRIYITLFDQSSHGISTNCVVQPSTSSPSAQTGVPGAPCS
jgi:uncharacterized membrane protein